MQPWQTACGTAPRQHAGLFPCGCFASCLLAEELKFECVPSYFSIQKENPFFCDVLCSRTNALKGTARTALPLRLGDETTAWWDLPGARLGTSEPCRLSLFSLLGHFSTDTVLVGPRALLTEVWTTPHCSSQVSLWTSMRQSHGLLFYSLGGMSG